MNQTWQNRLRMLLPCLGMAAVVVLFHIGLASLFSPGKTLADIFGSFCTWDCIWYKDIAEKGYYLKMPVELWTFGLGNVAFFPGLPMVASALMHLGVSVDYAVVGAAHIACWGWWTYVFLLWHRWQVPWLIRGVTLMTLLAHPAAFFLVMGYSESLFLLGLAGFVFWLGSPTRCGRLLAALHGWGMTATRVVGLPLTLFPLGRALIGRWRDPARYRWSWIVWEGWVTAVAASGTFLFFLFCWWQFGRWDVYTQLQLKGWQMKPVYGALFRWSTYQIPLYLPTLEADPNVLSRLSTTVTLLLLSVITLVDGIPILLHRRFPWMQVSQRWGERLILYWAAWTILAVSIVGLANIGLQSMIRYTMPVVMIMGLIFSHYATHLPGIPKATSPWAWLRRWWFLIPLVELLGVLFYTQGILIMRFTRFQWVA